MFTCVRKENADKDILVTTKNGDTNHAIYQNNELTSLKDKEVKQLEPAQMNYQNNAYRKHFSWLHFNDEPRVQER